jgi:hypothetical protein
LGETHGYNSNIVTSASTHNPSRTNQMIILSNSCICCYELNKWSSYRENYHLIWFVHARFDANDPSTPTIFCNFSANDLVFFGQDLHVQRRNKEEASMRKLQWYNSATAGCSSKREEAVYVLLRRGYFSFRVSQKAFYKLKLGCPTMGRVIHWSLTRMKKNTRINEIDFFIWIYRINCLK